MLLEILEHAIDRRLLVLRFLERKLEHEALIARLVELELGAGARRALRVQIQQLGGRVARLLRGLALRFLPLVRAEPMQRRVLGRRAAVARNEVQAQHGHVELVAAGVFEQQELRRHAFDVERRQAAIAADAVVLVHDGRADLQIRELANDGLGVARAPLALALPRPLHAEIGGRDDAQPARREAASRRESRPTVMPSGASPARNSAHVAYTCGS